MKTILFVCTGNTCRSPMAEYLFNLKAEAAGLDWRASSAGVSVFGAMPASHDACTALERRGGDMSRHVSRQVTRAMLQGCESALCMTGAHARLLIDRFPEFEDKIGLIAKRDISDPFGGGEDDYERAAQEIENAVDALIEQIRNMKNGSENS